MTHAKEFILANDHAALINCEKLGPDAKLSIPTPEHYLSLLYVLGSIVPEDVIRFPLEGIAGGMTHLTTNTVCNIGSPQ